MSKGSNGYTQRARKRQHSSLPASGKSSQNGVCSQVYEPHLNKSATACEKKASSKGTHVTPEPPPPLSTWLRSAAVSRCSVWTETKKEKGNPSKAETRAI